MRGHARRRRTASLRELIYRVKHPLIFCPPVCYAYGFAP
jgi:hypothetical protein